MFYGLDIWQEDGYCIEPGTFHGALWKSESPIPIPNVGEIIVSLDKRWRVKEREFEYGYVEGTDNEIASHVKLVVTPA